MYELITITAAVSGIIIAVIVIATIIYNKIKNK